MTQVRPLTDAQRAQMPAYAQKWIDIGLATVDPTKGDTIDQDAVAEAIPKVYAAGGYERPDDIIYVKSPLAAVFAARMALPAPVWDKGWPTDLESLELLAQKHRGVSVTHFLCYGAFDASWLSFYDFFWRECGVDECKAIEGFFQMAELAGWFFTLDKACIVSERPWHINRDDDARLHSVTDYAIDWTDGYGFCSVHGVRVPERYIFHPESITVDDVKAERNTEVQRIMMEQFGQTREEIRGYTEPDQTRREIGPRRFMEAADPAVVDSDNYGELLRFEQRNDEPLVMVRVVNSTPEPDGSYKKYLLRVPPTTRTAKEAVSWSTTLSTLDGPVLPVELYKPIKET